MQESELNHQILLFNWANVHSPKYPELSLLNASLNGVRLTMREALKAKASGMKKGYPDVFLPIAKQGRNGLFIEMKVGKNKCTIDQLRWHTKLQDQDYQVNVCYGFEDAKQTIINYLNLK